MKNIMKTTSFFTLVYSIIVFLSGMMAFRHADNMLGLYVEVSLGIILFVDSIFMVIRKKYADYIALISAAFLVFFYGYHFSGSHNYVFGVLSGVSVFMVIILVVKIFRISGEE
jgi:hypothetical protein